MPSDLSTSLVPLGNTILFTPLKLGRITLEHRIVQAPCTRMRCDTEARGVTVPGPRVVKYYGDRASAGGLQITEATDICLDAGAYPGAPGLFTTTQVKNWRKVTNEVHAKRGFIFLQLWHTGRASGKTMRGGKQPLSSVDTPMSGSFVDGISCAAEPPRAMTVGEIHELTAEWSAASKRAVDEAGFDGVEIHGGNGYLLEQFLHDNINTRTDEYGGSVENRCRFPLEVVEAVTKAIGADRVGIRLTPFNYFQDTRDSDPVKHWSYLCERIAKIPLGQRPVYVHMVEPRFDEVLDEQQKLKSLSNSTTSENGLAASKPDVVKYSLTPFRDILKKGGVAFLACGTLNRQNAVPKLESDGADLIVFGRNFIANPDHVLRLKNGWPLNPYERSTFYEADPLDKGYNDYPFYEDAKNNNGSTL